jgi:hypothetical protein
MYSLQTTKALWLTSDGLRQYIDVDVIQFTKKSFELHIRSANGNEIKCNLVSDDGFNYYSNVNQSVTPYSFHLRCFFKDLNILLYGNWKKGGHEGELCIHATSKILISDHNPDFPELPPAA